MSTYTPTTNSSSTAALMPTPSRKIYIRTGIGGAGNYKSSSSSTSSSSSSSYSASTLPTTTHTKLKPTPRTTGTFLTGIGGSGNSRRYEDRASLSHKEQLARNQLIRDCAPMAYHHGVGGAGNCAATVPRGLAAGSRGSASASTGGSSFSSSEMGARRDSYRRL